VDAKFEEEYMAVRDYNFPVYYTQGGGLVREVEVADECYEYVFVEAPPSEFGLVVGDFMPKEWDIIPANEPARKQLDE